MKPLWRDFRGWLASVVLGAYLKIEDWSSYETDTLQAFHVFLTKAKRDTATRLNYDEGLK